MQLVKLTTIKIINTLYRNSVIKTGFLVTVVFLSFTAFEHVSAQDNSPYSRYGVGDLVPPTNIISRGMGGLSAGYNEVLSINYNNPASFAFFQAMAEKKSKKLSSGRAILDLGINFDTRTLSEPNTNKNKFVANNALFSHVQIGVPLKQNWGMSFGIRPVSRISYKIINSERLKDPLTGLPIDSATTVYTGDGGSYLASIGTGFSLFHRVKHELEEKLSIGFTAGYLFGEKDYSTKRFFNNDTVDYKQANFETKTNYGNLNFNAGIQYRLPLNKKMLLTLGAYGSWGQKSNATKDVLRETYLYSESSGEFRLDSVSDQRNVKGKINLPASYTVGFVLQKLAVINKEGGWLVGIDFAQQNWDQYRFYGNRDSVRNKWELRLGGQINPVPKRNYFSNITYRFGLFTGPDYIKVGQKLNQFGGSFGLGLPLAASRQAPNQATLINLAFEYIKRGNDDNLLKENMFRVSLGFSLSDFWFIKRKYD
jgi:hypothetical protein